MTDGKIPLIKALSDETIIEELSDRFPDVCIELQRTIGIKRICYAIYKGDFDPDLEYTYTEGEEGSN